MGKSLSVCGEEAQYLVKTIAKLANQITYQFFTGTKPLYCISKLLFRGGFRYDIPNLSLMCRPHLREGRVTLADFSGFFNVCCFLERIF